MLMKMVIQIPIRLGMLETGLIPSRTTRLNGLTLMKMALVITGAIPHGLTVNLLGLVKW